MRAPVASALAVSASRLRTTLLGMPVEPDVVTTTAVPGRTSAGSSLTAPRPRAGPAPWIAERRARMMSRGSSPMTGSSFISRLVLPWVGSPVRLALLEERVTALDGLVGAVGEPGRLPREDLLTHEPV